MTTPQEALKEAMDQLRNVADAWQGKSTGRDIESAIDWLQIVERRLALAAPVEQAAAPETDSDVFWDLLASWAEARGYQNDKRSTRQESAEDAILAYIAAALPPQPASQQTEIGCLRSALYAIANTLNDDELREHARQAYDAAQPAAQPAGEVPSELYVECRECRSCQHVGINDSADRLAACHRCDWSGTSPVEDKCPGCGEEGTMTAACPKCGAEYALLADADLSIPSAQLAPIEIVDQWLREELGGVEADNVGKLQFAALVRLVERSALAQPAPANTPKLYTREEVQGWRDDIAHAAAKLCERANSPQYLIDDIRQLATAAQPAPKDVEWQRITKPGQVKVGTKLRFTIGDDKYSETAKQILHPGTDAEEIIYNKRKNYYLITSMAIDNKGSQKNVEFQAGIKGAAS